MTVQSLKLEGRVAIVTGAAQGIGRSIVQKLANEGAQVIANDLDADLLAESVDRAGNDSPSSARRHYRASDN